MHIDEEIAVSDRTLCRHFNDIDSSTRGDVSQDVLSQLRTFVERIMLKLYAKGRDIECSPDNYRLAKKYIETCGKLKNLYRFHNYLQASTSHYTFDEESSERLMLKYYEYLQYIKNLFQKEFNKVVLANLEKFPLHLDKTLQTYYEKIAEKICFHNLEDVLGGDRFYVQKFKPFFVNQKCYYEATLVYANDFSQKSTHIIAFTRIKINDCYSARFTFAEDSIEILGKSMPIRIITGWDVAIRNCEYENFIACVTGRKEQVPISEQKEIGKFLASTGYNLSDLLDLDDESFQNIETSIKANNRKFFRVLEKCRSIVQKQKPGMNILRYLLYRMNNVIIKNQYQNESNPNLSFLHLKNGCKPFDEMPFSFSLIQHNPRFYDLLDCIPTKNREHELLARRIKNNTEIKGRLFTNLKDVAGFGNIPELVKKYNQKIWPGHYEQGRLVIQNDQIFINGYKNDTCYIILKLKEMSSCGIQNYSSAIKVWLNGPCSAVDCIEKKDVLSVMFAESKVAFVYGSAGTGKSTLINYVAHFFADKRKLFLAVTNPAVENLKRRVTASNCSFSTIAKYLNRDKSQYDLVVIDECSTVSNSNMRNILFKSQYQLLLLVGDTYQISSIRFGNWFSVARSFMPKTSVFELKTPYRSNDEKLKSLWGHVREMDAKLLEFIVRQHYSVSLDDSIFERNDEDEIILCLNYDGLYGVNNINCYLQECNPNQLYKWGIQKYKVGDPILFNDSSRFSPILYNNMKGKIVNIAICNENNGYIQFDIELSKNITGMDAAGQDFKLLNNSERGFSVIRFAVYKTNNADEVDTGNSRTVVPFQLAYAVSIHKAQGLEYESVKIVITKEVDELITHNIFYTAITRARSRLKIYWTPEVENKILSSIHPRNVGKDVKLLREYLDP